MANIPKGISTDVSLGKLPPINQSLFWHEELLGWEYLNYLLLLYKSCKYLFHIERMKNPVIKFEFEIFYFSFELTRLLFRGTAWTTLTNWKVLNWIFIWLAYEKERSISLKPKLSR